MNSFAPQFLLLLLAACSCLAALPPPVGCRPGSRKLEGHRSCTCSRLAVWECSNIGHHHHRRDVDSQLDSLKCEPGAVWQQECNRCYCTDLGYAACTKKKCIDRPRIERDAPSAGGKLNGPACKLGESWHDGCNSCFCTAAGVVVCTVTHCPNDKSVGPKQKRSAHGPLGKECEPGKSWYDGCNHCACTETGLAICTLRYCESIGESKGAIRKQRAVQGEKLHGLYCKPGESWHDGCNSCFCTEAGATKCTTRHCPIDKYVGHKHKRSAPGGSNRCVPGTTWIASHMECHCTEDGATICHLLHRPPMAFPSMAKRSAIGGGQECTPGTTWKEDCNSCGCDERGEAYCTDMACNHPDPARNTRETHGPNSCTPGSTWMDDCNRCICTNDGFTACTDMACSPKHEVTKRSPETEDEGDRCNPGDRWTEECNRCVCSRTGEPICTRMSCHPHPVELKSKRSVSVSPGCKAGDSWKDDCNFCRCANGVPICTRAMCPHRRKRTVDDHGNQIKCTPGETFMMDCNTCRCGPDGKTAGCTYMFCPPGLKPKIP